MFLMFSHVSEVSFMFAIPFDTRASSRKMSSCPFPSFMGLRVSCVFLCCKYEQVNCTLSS
jgi:hypothetical protein